MAHVAPADLPLVVLLHEDRADQPDDSGAVGEDPDVGLLRIAQTVTTVDNGLVWSEDAKTEAGARVVALVATTVAALRAHRARQLEERMMMGPAWHDDEYGPLVFPRPDG